MCDSIFQRFSEILLCCRSFRKLYYVAIAQVIKRLIYKVFNLLGNANLYIIKNLIVNYINTL